MIACEPTRCPRVLFFILLNIFWNDPSNIEENWITFVKVDLLKIQWKAVFPQFSSKLRFSHAWRKCAVFIFAVFSSDEIEKFWKLFLTWISVNIWEKSPVILRSRIDINIQKVSNKDLMDIQNLNSFLSLFQVKMMRTSDNGGAIAIVLSVLFPSFSGLGIFGRYRWAATIMVVVSKLLLG